MIIFTNENGEIKDVGNTTDTSLNRVKINDEENPFKNWSTFRICSYRVQVVDGQVVMMTPYKPTNIIEAVDGLGKEVDAITPYTETKTAYIGDTEVVFFPPFIGNVTVYFDKPYTMEKLSDRIIISFDELEEVTEITISII